MTPRRRGGQGILDLVVVLVVGAVPVVGVVLVVGVVVDVDVVLVVIGDGERWTYDRTRGGDAPPRPRTSNEIVAVAVIDKDHVNVDDHAQV